MLSRRRALSRACGLRSRSKDAGTWTAGLDRARDAAALGAADRAYKELFLRGARLTAPGGLLVLCSCSGRVSRGHFDELVADALADAGRGAQILAREGAGRDHPELVGVPETGHLKCWVLRVL